MFRSRIRVISRFWLPAALLIAGLSNTASAAVTPCPYERAHYALKNDPNVVAGFVRHHPFKDILTDLFFYVTIKSRGWTYWYFPDEGNGYSQITMISMQDPSEKNWRQPEPDTRAGRPFEDEHYFGFGPDLTADQELPRSGIPAPAFIFLPDLGSYVWYSSGNGTPGKGERYRMPREFFVLNRCR